MKIPIDQAIREGRKRKKLTQTQLAELIGAKARTSVAAWEQGYNFPTLLNLVRLRKVLDLDLNEIDFSQCKRQKVQSGRDDI